MTDEPKVTSLPIREFDVRTVPTTFVNQCVGAGHLNGVVNLTMATAQFTPNNDGTVDPDIVITCRLRMDIACAAQLYDQLGKILDQMSKQTVAALAPASASTH